MAKVEKLSVIIPTIQKNLFVLEKLLHILNSDTVVSEILLINNCPKKLTGFKEITKLKIFNMPQNLYVNPSWNFGIDNISNDLFLIINDDILPIKNFAGKILSSGILDKKMTGLVGINPACICQYDRISTTDIIQPEDEGNNLSFFAMNNYRNTGDWGSAFFGRKNNYYKIPEDIKIIFGDNYLLYRNLTNAKINYLINGIPFNHIHSLSSASSEFNLIVQSDIQNQQRYIP